MQTEMEKIKHLSSLPHNYITPSLRSKSHEINKKIRDLALFLKSGFFDRIISGGLVYKDASIRIIFKSDSTHYAGDYIIYWKEQCVYHYFVATMGLGAELCTSRMDVSGWVDRLNELYDQHVISEEKKYIQQNWGNKYDE